MEIEMEEKEGEELDYQENILEIKGIKQRRILNNIYEIL